MRAAQLGDVVQHVAWRVPLIGSALVSAEMRRLPRRPGRVLFLCHGNICRSVFAEHVARRAAGNGARWTFSSAGLEAKPGSRSPELAVTVAGRRGIDLAAHRSRGLSRDELEHSDVVFVMEPHQRRHKLLDRGAGVPPALLLGAWCRQNGPAARLRDPYDRDEACYETVFDQIESAVDALIQSLSADGP
jgi:protein-tyrosine phosphatase